MTINLSADFDTRRDAEMAVEHIVQEHGIDRGAVMIAPVAEENSAGVRVAGSDREGGHDKEGTTGEPALTGRLRVSVDADEAASEKVRGSFATYGGHRVD